MTEKIVLGENFSSLIREFYDLLLVENQDVIRGHFLSLAERGFLSRFFRCKYFSLLLVR